MVPREAPIRGRIGRFGTTGSGWVAAKAEDTAVFSAATFRVAAAVRHVDLHDGARIRAEAGDGRRGATLEVLSGLPV